MVITEVKIDPELCSAIDSRESIYGWIDCKVVCPGSFMSDEGDSQGAGTHLRYHDKGGVLYHQLSSGCWS